MNQDAILVNLCQTLLSEMELIQDWQKVIVVGSIDPENGASSVSGYSFDHQGEWEGSAPDADTFDILEELRDTMAEQSPTGSKWLGCLIKINNEGRFNVDFEYHDIDRWSITPANFEQRIAEFAAMSI